MNRVLFASYRVAMRFKNTYLFRFQRQYGFDMEIRRKNELRRALNFSAITKYGLIAKDTNDYLANFIFKTFLIFNTSKQFTKYNDNLLYVQEQRRNIQTDRDVRFEMVYQRLSDYKEFFMSNLCYGSKKAKNKKGNPKQIKDSLKKMFPKKGKKAPDAVALMKSQLAILDERNVIENKAFLWSIKARELTIVK